MGTYSIDISSSEEYDTDDGNQQRRTYSLRSATKKKKRVFDSVDNTPKRGGGRTNGQLVFCARSTRSNTSSTTKKVNKVVSSKRRNLPMRSTRYQSSTSSHNQTKIAHNIPRLPSLNSTEAKSNKSDLVQPPKQSAYDAYHGGTLEDGFEETETEGYDDELSVESDAAVFTRDSNKGNKDDNTSKSAVVPKSFWSLEDYRDTGVMSDDDDESVARCYDKDDVAPDEAEKDSNDGATKLSTSVINLTPPRFLLPRVSEEANDGGGSTKKQSSEDESPSNKLYSSFNQELKHDEASTEDETPVDEDKVTGQPEKQLLLLLDAPYGSHTKLFEGPQDKASDNVDVLSGELSGVKFKSDQARKDPAEALNAILDMSYLKSGVHAAKILGNTTTSNNDVHRKRVMFVLDNPKRAEALVAMCLRNDEDIDLPDLMRQFDYFSSF